MKKTFFGLILITLCTLMLGAAALFAGCDTPSGEKADYSVTVLSPSEEPLSGITVSWKNGSATAGSAQSDADGKATASLVVGTYTIELSGYEEGLEYDEVAVGSSMRNVTLQLSVMRLDYTVTVTDKDGAPAANVSVNWTKNGSIAGSAKTGADGKATTKLNFGEYSVTLSNLPADNIYDGAKTVNGSNPSTEFALRSGVTQTYSVTVRSEGGLLFKDQSLFVDKGETQVTSGWTDENGVFTFNAAPDNYTVSVANIQDGYSCEPLELTAEKTEDTLILYSEVINDNPMSGQKYVMGDIIHNYSFTTPYEMENGAVWSSTVAEILQKKQVLLINNWGTQCSWCVKEMPDMQELYEKYSDKIEIVAVSNYRPLDTDKVIQNHYASNGFTFPMMCDANGFDVKFGITGWPTTVVIDRYGAIARIESGAITSFEAWERMILKYIGDDYVQTFTPGESISDSINNEMAKPDIELDDDHYDKIAQAMNGEGVDIKWFGETEYEYAWPFILGTDKDVSPDEVVMYSSNTGKANSMSIIYATVKIDAGKVLTFDYYSDTEADDILTIVWDGKIVKEISGYSKGWKTCYLYADLISGEHYLSLAYKKDYDKNEGNDNVYIRRVRYCEISAITDSNDMLRGAAYGTPAENADKFPHYAEVELKADGYYHVKLASLENSQFAGNDESPLLLANMLNATAWFNELSIFQLATSINATTNDFIVDCEFTINGEKRDYRKDLLEYCKAAAASDVPDYVPVDSFLHDLLVAFMQKVDEVIEITYHEDEWLEACYFYSHYGDGNPVVNPVLGLMKRSAIPVNEGTTYTADLTRNIAPFPTVIYSFTPTADAVYKIESFIPDEDAGTYSAQIWLYDDDTDPDSAIVHSGEDRMHRGGVNEQNFEAYRYMKAGHKYYIEVAFQMLEGGQLDIKISNVGQSVTVMTQCSADVYNMGLDELGNFNGEIYLADAVDVVFVEEGEDGHGYYHSKNADGTIGDYIYLDVINADSAALSRIPLNKLIDYFAVDPDDFSDLDYKMFDFRYCVMYYKSVDEEGAEITDYNPKVEIASADHPEYKDYTEILRKYIEGAEDGLVKVDKTLVKILSLYFELRLNAIYAEIKDNVNEYTIESALENEWLRFCWYNRVYNENNP